MSVRLQGTPYYTSSSVFRGITVSLAVVLGAWMLCGCGFDKCWARSTVVVVVVALVVGVAVVEWRR